MSTSTAPFKPKGISKEDYVKIQKDKDAEDFKLGTNQKLQTLQFSIEGLHQMLNKVIGEQGAVRVDCEAQLTEVITATMDSLKRFGQELGNLNTEMNQHVQLANFLRDHLDNFATQEDLKVLKGEFVEVLKEIKIQINAVKEDLKNDSRSKTQSFDDKLKALREEIYNRPSEIPSLKSYLDCKLELVELNGQNSVLRSSNNESQLQLIEKKIENIYQLLKKYKLTSSE